MAEEKKQAALKIVIDDGSQRIPIENMNGDEIGVFYFHLPWKRSISTRTVRQMQMTRRPPKP